MKQYTALVMLLLFSGWQACTTTHTIEGQPKESKEVEPLQVPGIASAQVGICLYDPATAKYIYNYQGDKYFIPASNTKLFSLYAGLKYLGDSLTGMRCKLTDTALMVIPTGDPTFLHPAFPSQPVLDQMKKAGRDISLVDGNWQDNAMGRGWAWDDYNDDYAAERSPFPIYGNMIRWVQERQQGSQNSQFGAASPSIYSIPDIDWPVRFTTDTTQKAFFVHRRQNENLFEVTEGKEKYRQQYTPFITNGLASAALLLKDTAGHPVSVARLQQPTSPSAVSSPISASVSAALSSSGWSVIHSRPVDSLFKPMMYNSDNFFAEQTLLMVSNERLGIMKDNRIIDTLLRSDLKDLPQKPNWVDGCGLSRNDWFTPQDFVWILDKMKNEFGLDRMKRILPTGGTGTLANYYKQDSGYIFAKTGSLSGVVALSGYLITKKDHLYIFSILVNNYIGNGVALRKEMERLIHTYRDTY